MGCSGTKIYEDTLSREIFPIEPFIITEEKSANQRLNTLTILSVSCTLEQARENLETVLMLEGNEQEEVLSGKIEGTLYADVFLRTCSKIPIAVPRYPIDIVIASIDNCSKELEQEILEYIKTFTSTLRVLLLEPKSINLSELNLDKNIILVQKSNILEEVNKVTLFIETSNKIIKRIPDFEDKWIYSNTEIKGIEDFFSSYDVDAIMKCISDNLQTSIYHEYVDKIIDNNKTFSYESFRFLANFYLANIHDKKKEDIKINNNSFKKNTDKIGKNNYYLNYIIYSIKQVLINNILSNDERKEKTDKKDKTKAILSVCSNKNKKPSNGITMNGTKFVGKYFGNLLPKLSLKTKNSFLSLTIELNLKSKSKQNEFLLKVHSIIKKHKLYSILENEFFSVSFNKGNLSKGSILLEITINTMTNENLLFKIRDLELEKVDINYMLDFFLSSISTCDQLIDKLCFNSIIEILEKSDLKFKFYGENHEVIFNIFEETLKLMLSIFPYEISKYFGIDSNCIASFNSLFTLLNNNFSLLNNNKEKTDNLSDSNNIIYVENKIFNEYIKGMLNNNRMMFLLKERIKSFFDGYSEFKKDVETSIKNNQSCLKKELEEIIKLIDYENIEFVVACSYARIGVFANASLPKMNKLIYDFVN